MRKVVENVKLFFCDFDYNGNFKPCMAMKYFEKSRFDIANILDIFNYFEDEAVTFPVLRVKCDYSKFITLKEKRAKIVTYLEVPDAGLLRFYHSIEQRGVTKCKAIVDVAVVSEKRGLLFQIDEYLVEKIKRFTEGADEEIEYANTQ